TPEECIAAMVEVFRQVRRVLRRDGTLWLNCGDNYVDKQLAMMPARLALALQADGWWLRSDIIWAKPNPMPESVTDRPTTAHEHIFLLTRSATYFYDAEAVREPHAPKSFTVKTTPHKGATGEESKGDRFNTWLETSGNGRQLNPNGRKMRTGWEIATQPYPEAHFATFPEELARRCIAAGTSERGCCPECGAPWRRVVEITGQLSGRERNRGGRADGYTLPPQWENRQNPTSRSTSAWLPD